MEIKEEKRNSQPFAQLGHAQVPCRDHVTLAEWELECAASVPAAVKLGAVWKGASVVHRHLSGLDDS